MLFFVIFYYFVISIVIINRIEFKKSFALAKSLEAICGELTTFLFF
jgi:hypothetical protein